MILWFSVLLCLCVSVVLLFCFSVALFVYLLPFLCSSVSLFLSLQARRSLLKAIRHEQTQNRLVVSAHEEAKRETTALATKVMCTYRCCSVYTNVLTIVLYSCTLVSSPGFFSSLQKLEKCSMELGSVLEENEALKNEFVQLHQRHRDNERTVTM